MIASTKPGSIYLSSDLAPLSATEVEKRRSFNRSRTCKQNVQYRPDCAHRRYTQCSTQFPEADVRSNSWPQSALLTLSEPSMAGLDPDSSALQSTLKVFFRPSE